VLQSLCASNFIYFYTFHGLKLMQGKEMPSSAGRDLLLASIAGVVNVLSTTPLWVVNTRIKMQDKKNKSRYRGLLRKLSLFLALQR